MTQFINDILNEGVAEYRQEPYSDEQQAIIVRRAVTTNNNRYDCGVLKNLDYYEGFLSFVKFNNMWLKYSEFKSITMSSNGKGYDGWLDMEVVDYYLKLKMSQTIKALNIEQGIKLLSLRNTQHLFFDPAKFKSLPKKSKKPYEDTTTQYLMMPVLSPGHYFTVIIDNKNRIFYYLDSGASNGNSRVAKTMMTRFRDRTSRLDFETVALKVQSQEDSYSCGIFSSHFVIAFIDHIASGTTEIKIPPITDKEQKRIEMRNDILKLSDDITNICPKCYKHAESSCSSCSFCQRKLHGSCIEGSTGTIKTESCVICFECTHFLLSEV